MKKKYFSLCLLLFLMLCCLISCSFSFAKYNENHLYRPGEIRLVEEFWLGGFSTGDKESFFSAEKEDDVPEQQQCVVQGITYEGVYASTDCPSYLYPYVRYRYGVLDQEKTRFSLRADTGELVFFTQNITYEEEIAKDIENSKETAILAAKDAASRLINDLDRFTLTEKVLDTYMSSESDTEEQDAETILLYRFSFYETDDETGVQSTRRTFEIDVTSKGTIKRFELYHVPEVNIQIDEERIRAAISKEVQEYCDKNNLTIKEIDDSDLYIVWDQDGAPYVFCHQIVWCEPTSQLMIEYAEEKGVSMNFRVEVKLK